MPDTTRHRMPVAALVGCLALVGASAVPAAAREPAPPPAQPWQQPAQPPPWQPAPAPQPGQPGQPGPAATAPDPGGTSATATGSPTGSPSPPTRPTPVRNAVPPPVTVAVSAAGQGAPDYRIQVRNAGRTPVFATVRQTLPPGASPTSISDGGQATTGGTEPDEITWLVLVPGSGSTTLRSVTSPAPPGRSVTAPACVFGPDGTTPYDCATATWKSALPATTAKPAPLWRRPPVALGGLVAVLLLAVAGGLLWRRRRRRRSLAYPQPGSGGADPAAVARAQRGTVYPRPATPTIRRRRPPVWLAVSGALLALGGLVGAAGWTATVKVNAANASRQPTGGAWIGRTTVGTVGTGLREDAFEFTVYRMTCQPTPTARRCQTTVGVRNMTPHSQTWYSQQQRAYLPDGNWVSVDDSATRAANQGRDVFAAPVPAQGRLLLPLVFTIANGKTPKQLELRSGVFSAGVRVDLP